MMIRSFISYVQREEIRNAKIIYRMMNRIRRVEEEIAERYAEKKMRCPTHLSIGQEAVPCALSMNLNKQDFAVSTHRCHAHYLSKGGDLKKMISELYGKSTGCSQGKGGSMHLIDKKVGFMGSSAIVGNSIPIGTGIGLSLKLRDSSDVSVVYFGEGATEEGAFYESLNFAILKKLNVIYICENNLYSVYSPLSVRVPKSRNIPSIAKAMGIATAKGINGNDPLRCFKVFKKQINMMREKRGPVLIECSTYRWREHCGPNYDNNLGYREEKEYQEWKKRDPIVKLQRFLQKRVKNFDEYENNMFQELNSEIKEAFDYAEKSEFPEQKDRFNNIYAEKAGDQI